MNQNNLPCIDISLIVTGLVLVSVFGHLHKYFSYIVVVSFIGGGTWSTWRRPPTCHKSLTDLIA